MIYEFVNNNRPFVNIGAVWINYCEYYIYVKGIQPAVYTETEMTSFDEFSSIPTQ